MSEEPRRRRQKTFAPRVAAPAAVRPRPPRPAARPAARPAVDPAVLRPPDPGRPLEPEVRRRLEDALHRRLAHVRVHTEPADRERTHAMGARAFTHRHHIWLGPHERATDIGLIAHEVTHVAQQGCAPRYVRVARSPGAASPDHAVGPRAIGRVNHQPAAAVPARPAVPAVQRAGLDLWGRARRAAGAVASGVRGAVGAVREAGSALLARGRQYVLDLVARVAPGFLPLFQGGGIASFFRELVSSAFRSLFGGLLGPFRSAMAFAGRLGAAFGQAVSWFSMVAGQLARNDCSAIIAAARRVGSFFSSTFGPVVDKVRSVARTVSGFFRSIWESVGAPVVDFLKQIGGALWQSLRGFISDVGALIGRVKSALGSAWDQVKEWLGIQADEGTEEGGGLWNWIKKKASSVWDGIKELLAPVMGPLRVVGGVLVMLSPAGPVIAVVRAWPHLRRAFAWVQEKWRDLNLVVRARRFFANTVIPAVRGAAERVGGALIAGADWLLGMVSRISQGVARAAGAVSGGILEPLGRVVRFAQEQFQRLVDWARGGLRQASTGLRSLFARVIAFLQPVWDVLKRIIAIAVNPFGIPGLLLGTLWRIIPDCLKGPIIDFIVDVLLRVLRALPPMPMLGPLFPFVKAGLIGFLEKVKTFDMDRKVAVSNKMAKIISGGSATFAFGYLKGLAIGIWEAVIGPIKAIADLFELPGLIQAFFRRLRIDPSELLGAVGSALGSLDSVLEAARDLLLNPSKIIDLLRSALDAALSTATELGGTVAEQMMSLFEQAEDQIGELLGRLVGETLVTAVLSIFSGGAAGAAKAISSVVRILGRAARAIAQVARQILRFIPRILKFVNKIAGKFRSAGSRAGGILGRVRGFLQRLMARLRRFGGRRRGRRGGRNRAWRRFKRGARRVLLRNRLRGIAQAQLRTRIMQLRARNLRGVASASVRRKRGTGYLKVRARKRGLGFFRGQVLMDRPTRWRLGGIAIRKRLKLLKRLRILLMVTVKASLRGIKRKFGYRQLDVRFNNATNEFIAHGAMSPGQPLGKVPAPKPKRNDFKSIGKRASKVDPLVRRSHYAAPVAWPADTAAVRRVRLKTGIGMSLYVRGHLVSGKLGGTGNPENLTPITREANAAMASGMEARVKERLRKPRDKRGVFSYTVRGVGRARGPIHLRAVRATLGAARVWQLVPEERQLARTISMSLRRKRYNYNAGTWVNDRVVARQSVRNTPTFPEGWREPKPADLRPGDIVSAGFGSGGAS